MNFSALKTIGNGGVSRVAGKAAFTLRKYSPEILTTVGILGTVTAGVLAARATLNLEPIIDNAQAKIEYAEEKTHSYTADQYSSADHKKAMFGIYLTTAGDISKLYAPSIILGVASIGCIVGGHGVMQKRNVAAIAAYKGLEESFNKYRKRVIEEFGEEKDQEIVYGITKEKETDAEGVERIINIIDPEHLSPEMKIFAPNNRNWEPSPDYNLNFLKAQENMANQRLRAHGFIILNDILDALGFDKTQAGAITGWTMDGEGDGYIDFGIHDAQSDNSRIFGTDYDDAVFLNFNVDGIILGRLPIK